MEISCQFNQPLQRKVISIFTNRNVKDWCHVLPFQPNWATKLVMSVQEKKWHGWRWQHFTPWENAPDRRRARLSAMIQLESYAIWTVKKNSSLLPQNKSSNLYLKQRHIPRPDLTQGDDAHTYSGLKHLSSWHVKDTIARSCGEACPCMPASLELYRVGCQ